MTTKKPKPLTILGSPLRKSRYGWIAKTKLGVVRVYARYELFGCKVHASIIITNNTCTSLPVLPAPLDQRCCNKISSKLRSIHRACQVKL